MEVFMDENKKESIWRQILWIKKNKIHAYNKQQEKMFDVKEYVLNKKLKN